MESTRALALLQDDTALCPRDEEHYQLEALWLIPARAVWRSLAILSAHASGSAGDLAQTLAIVGKPLSNSPSRRCP